MVDDLIGGYCLGWLDTLNDDWLIGWPTDDMIGGWFLGRWINGFAVSNMQSGGD